MTKAQFLEQLRQSPLIASVQASEGSPLGPGEIALIANASLNHGVQIIRLEGSESINAVRSGSEAGRKATVIGLIKKKYPGSDVYITPTSAEIDALLATDCEVIALDGTQRSRSNEDLTALIQRIHAGGKLAMADCDSKESAQFSLSCGADFIGTTLSGYTSAEHEQGPDLELVRTLAKNFSDSIVIAEGRFSDRWEVECAILAGAAGVCIGSALNDPVKQTVALRPRFLSRPAHGAEMVGAVDIGGTWLRFAKFSPDWKLISIEKEPNPHNHTLLLGWIKGQVKASGVKKVGVSTGGIVDPSTGLVWKAKEYLMPDHVGIVFNEESVGAKTIAWGDGHATAWAHGCLPEFAGKRVATIAIGTGVGCGFVCEGKIWCGPRGEYPRLNDQPTKEGPSYEELLGGIHLTKTPTDEQKSKAVIALKEAVNALQSFYFADSIVIGGGVGLSDWLAPQLADDGLLASPFGPDAGLYGAAALALFSL